MELPASTQGARNSAHKMADICVGLQQNLGFIDSFLVKVFDIEFYGDPSSGSRADTCGRTDRQAGRQTERQTDRQRDRQIDRETDRQRDRHRQTDRQTDR